MDKYQNKYRISSARAPFWDYGWNAAYFVTICTHNRVCWFGKIVEAQHSGLPKQMQLSEIGKIAEQCWQEIPGHFPFVELGAFVIMPDHVHGIVIIDKPDDGRNDGNENENNAETQNPAETQDFASLQNDTNKPKNKFGPQSKNLASIIRGFKIGVTKNARCIDPEFSWQSRYHDHIIRNGKSYDNISRYIINNPAKWNEE